MHRMMLQTCNKRQAAPDLVERKQQNINNKSYIGLYIHIYIYIYIYILVYENILFYAVLIYRIKNIFRRLIAQQDPSPPSSAEV